jgi:cytochrome P450
MEDVVIDGCLIPKGTTVTVMPAIIHLNPHIWGDDADQFKPSRWTQGPIDPYAFAAFSQGPRQCLGKVWSALEFKIILIEVLSKFRFTAIETENVLLLNPSPLLRPKDGMKVKVERLG